MKIFTHSFNVRSNQANNLPVGINGVLRVVLLILATFFIVAVVILGVDQVSRLFVGKVIVTAQILMGVFVFCIYPLSRLNKFRPFLVIPSVLIAYLLGACAWGYSLLFVMTGLGVWGVIFCFLFQTLTPITMIGAILKGSWDVVGNLAFWLIASYMIRFFSGKLQVDFVRQKKNDRVIDVEAEYKD